MVITAIYVESRLSIYCVLLEKFYLKNITGGYIIVKTKFLTANVDVAAFAAFGGLTVVPMFPLFLEAHGLRYSVVALVITLWGFLSLKQMDTQRVEETAPIFHKPQHRKNNRKLITAAVLVLIIGVMLSGTIDIIGATQTDTTPCLEWTQKDCLKEKQQSPCPQLQRKSHCTLNAAAR